MGASQCSEYAYIDKQNRNNPSNSVATNSIAIDMTKWHQIPEPCTGDPVRCQRCNCFLNIHSSKERIGDNQYRWRCEFCNEVNELDLDEEELPKEPNQLYILSGAPTADTQTPQDADQQDQSSVVFCLDISGSMNVKTNGASRLDCVKQAITEQIQSMMTELPNRKIKLVCFERQVRVYGDYKPQTMMNCDKQTFEGCLTYGRNFQSDLLNQPVSFSGDTWINILSSIQPTGMTALGPGLSVALGLAEVGQAGSQVIICTDGLANIGIGAFEGKSTNEQEFAAQFYQQAGVFAKERGIAVSVISIEGAECKLSYLSDLADLTGGALTKVDPMNLGEDFGLLLSDRVLATNAIATITIHKALKFLNVDANSVTEQGSRIIKDIGNLTVRSQFGVQFSVKSTEELQTDEIDLDELNVIPFQLSVEYTTTTGARHLRVISQVQQVTTDIQAAENNANFEALAANYNVFSAQMIEEGNYEDYQAQQGQWEQVMTKNIRSDKHQTQFKKMQQVNFSNNLHINQQYEVEQKRGLQINAQNQKMARRQYRGDSLQGQISKMKKRF